MPVTLCRHLLRAMLVVSTTMGMAAAPNPADTVTRKIGFVELDEIEKLVNGYTPDPRFPDDPFVKVTLQEALAGSREGNGGIGACLVLYSSVEPCPMCLTRIINVGLKKAFFVAPDPKGGMVQRLKDLPPFWQGMAAGNVYDRADCSPELSALAARLFRPMGGRK
jgi:hypothetical protein